MMISKQFSSLLIDRDMNSANHPELNINKLNTKGNTPLINAIFAKDLVTMKTLLERGANVNTPNSKGETPFSIVFFAFPKNFQEIQNFYIPAIDLLLSYKPNVNVMGMFGNPLHDIPKSGYYKAQFMDRLHELGIDVNAKNTNGNTPLHNVVQTIAWTPMEKEEEMKAIEKLLAWGANINAQNNLGETPLYLAAMDSKILKVLLENGADPHIAKEGGYTPLHRAVQTGWIDSVKLLLEYGANVNSRSIYNETILDSAVFQRKIEIIKLLLDNKADVNIRNERNRTPIYEAIRLKRLDIIELLLRYGADMDVRDYWNQTPLDVATPDFKPQLQALLVRMSKEKVKNTLQLQRMFSKSRQYSELPNNAKRMIAESLSGKQGMIGLFEPRLNPEFKNRTNENLTLEKNAILTEIKNSLRKTNAINTAPLYNRLSKLQTELDERTSQIQQLKSNVKRFSTGGKRKPHTIKRKLKRRATLKRK